MAVLYANPTNTRHFPIPHVVRPRYAVYRIRQVRKGFGGIALPVGQSSHPLVSSLAWTARCCGAQHLAVLFWPWPGSLLHLPDVFFGFDTLLWVYCILYLCSGPESMAGMQHSTAWEKKEMWSCHLEQTCLVKSLISTHRRCPVNGLMPRL